MLRTVCEGRVATCRLGAFDLGASMAWCICRSWLERVLIASSRWGQRCKSWSSASDRNANGITAGARSWSRSRNVRVGQSSKVLPKWGALHGWCDEAIEGDPCVGTRQEPVNTSERLHRTVSRCGSRREPRSTIALSLKHLSAKNRPEEWRAHWQPNIPNQIVQSRLPCRAAGPLKERCLAHRARES